MRMLETLAIRKHPQSNENVGVPQVIRRNAGESSGLSEDEAKEIAKALEEISATVMANQSGQTTEYKCGNCNEVWDKDKNGLVPSVCVKNPSLYGYWTPNIEELNSNIGCPSCNEDAWEWNRQDDEIEDSVTVKVIS